MSAADDKLRLALEILQGEEEGENPDSTPSIATRLEKVVGDLSTEMLSTMYAFVQIRSSQLIETFLAQGADDIQEMSAATLLMIFTDGIQLGKKLGVMEGNPIITEVK